MFSTGLKITQRFCRVCLQILALTLSVNANGTAIDVEQNLDPRLTRLHEEVQNQRLITGGVMLVIGTGAFAAAALSASVSNPTPYQSYPLTFGVIGALLSAGGFYVLSSPGDFELKLESTSEIGDTQIESIEEKAKEGTALLKEYSDKAATHRRSGAIGLGIAGLSQIAISFSGSAPPSPGAPSVLTQDLDYAGGLFSLAGFYFLVVDKSLSLGAPLAAVGIADVITTMFDPTAPSSDYLLTTGTILVAASAWRFFFSDQVEKETEEFNSSKISFNISPMRSGALAGFTIQF